jgi:hypothetical protein
LPQASRILRLLAFAVPSGLAIAGLQPWIAAAAGAVSLSWATSLGLPSLGAAALVFVSGRLFDRGDSVQPPWYSAWVLLPGAFLLAGAAAMCIFGALVELSLIPVALWGLLAAGSISWAAAIVLVRKASR